MKILKFFTLPALFLLCSVEAYSLEGLVEVSSTYQDYRKVKNTFFANDKQIIKGSGFVVDYPVEYMPLGEKATLKVVLTAAHLVLGGIYSTRHANLQLKIKNTQQNLSYMGLVADAVNDLAIIFLCTPDNIQFMDKVLKSENSSYSSYSSYDQFQDLFKQGEGCLPNQKTSFNSPSFASYKGEYLQLTPLKKSAVWNDDVSDWIMKNGKLVSNQSFKPNQFIKVDASTALPDLDVSEELVLQSESEEGGELSLKAVDLLRPNKFNDFAFEKFLNKPLKKGFSGAPILQQDLLDNSLTVTGVYKSSTVNSVSGGVGYGWYNHVDMSKGLLQQFLQTYPTKMHTWSIVPQVYILSLDGHLVREHRFPGHSLIEIPNGYNELINFMRKDRGGSEWVRADTGDGPPNKGEFKALTKVTVPDLEEAPVAGLLYSSDSGRTLYPPTIEAIRFVSKYNCISCSNANSSTFKSGSVDPVANEGGLAKALSITMPQKTEFYLASTSKEDGAVQSIQVLVDDKGSALRITLNWASDSLMLHILYNNKISFIHPEKGLQNLDYQPVLKIKSKNGKEVSLELAGLLYYNTELPEGYPYNGKAFRMVVDGKFHLMVNNK